MWISQEEARSDFVLAAAAALFGPLLQGFVAGLPGYPRGLAGTVLSVAWMFAMTGLVPVLLARYRKHGLSAFGLDQPSQGLTTGVVVAAPLALAGWATFWVAGVDPLPALLGTLPVLAGGYSLPVDLLVFAVVGLGALLFYTFLTVRARDAFRPTHLSQVEALRTFGMGATGVSAVLGLLEWLSGRVGFSRIGLTTVGIAGLVLLTDRYVAPEETTTRATVLAPAIAVLVFWVFRLGGLFSGNLLDGLYFGTVAATVTIVVAILVETRRYAWGAVPVVVAALLYGTPLVI